MDNNRLSEIVDEGVFEIGQKVQGTVYNFSPLGVKVAIDDMYSGLIFNNEVFQDLKVGDKVTVYVKNIREDGKLDLSLQQTGYKNFIENSTDKIITLLKEADGFLPFNDKSSPETIYEKFQISKKKFKETIGFLYKKRKIEITKEGIKLI